MQIWITFILINIIHQTHVSAAPYNSKFGDIAKTIINPAWTLNNPNSLKTDNEDTDLNDKNDENLSDTEHVDTQYPDTKNKKKNNSHKKNIGSGKKRNNNKRRIRNNSNNTRRNGRYLWYSVFTMDDLQVNLPEYRNHEDEQKIVLIWDDKRRIVQNENVDVLSMNNLNKNQLIRQKRDYNNILELQDYKLQTRNDNQHNLEKNENNTTSNTNENINENMKFLNLRNSNTNKFKNILQNRKQPTNTIRNKINRPNHPQGLDITLGADNSQKEGSQLKIIEENPQKINAMTTLSNGKPELIIEENNGIDKNTPEIVKIDTLINGMNSNSDESANDVQDSEPYLSSIKTKNAISNYSDIEDNKQHEIIKNIKHQFKPKSRKLEKKQPQNNDKGTLQTRFIPNAPTKNYQKAPSIDKQEHKKEENTNIAKNIPVNDEIDRLINTMNSNSEEDSFSENSDSNTSSLEKQQDIQDISDLIDNKKRNLLKSIKQPLKPISKTQGKKFLENNKKIPGAYKKNFNNILEIKNEEGPQQENLTPKTQNLDQDKIKSTPTYDNFKPNIIQKKKIIKTPDLMDIIVPETNKNIKETSTEITFNDIDVTDSLEGLNNLGGITMENADEEKVDDKFHSSALDYNNKEDHDIIKKINKPIFKNPNTGNSKRKYAGNNSKIKSSTTRNRDDKPNTIQKKESIKTPDIINVVVPKSTEKVLDLSTKPSINGMDVSDSLKEYNRLGGFTTEDADLGKMKDKSPSSVLKNKNKKDLKDRQEKTIQNPNRNIHQTSIPTNAVVIPKTISETQENEEFDVTSDSTSMEDLLDLSLDIDAVDVSQPGFKKKKDITMSTTNDIISNGDDGTLQPNPTNSDDKSYTIQKNESIKTPDKIDTVVPKSTEKVPDLSTKPSINSMDVSDSLKEYNRLGGFTTEDADLGKMKDKSPSSVLKNKNKKDLKDSQEKTIQNPNRNIHQTSIPTNAVKIPKTISETQENEKFDVTSDSTSMEDLLGLSLDIDAVDVSQPGFKKKKDITLSTTNDIISNVDDGTLQPYPTNSDHKSYTIQKNESIKTPDKIDIVVPKSTEKVLDLSTKPSINGMDVSDSLKEYNRLGGFTTEDADLGKMKDKSPSSVLKNKNKKDLKDSQEKTIQNPNRNIHQTSIPTNAVIIPKTISETLENEEFDVTSDSTSMKDLLDLSLDIDAVDVSQPGIKKKKDITMSTTNDIISNGDDGTLQPNPTNSDDKSYTIQKNESIKTPDKIDTVVPKSTEKVPDLSTKPSINSMDVSDSLKEYNRLGGFTTEDADLGKMKDKSPSSVLKNKNKKDLKDSQEKTIQNPNRNIHQTSIPTNAVIIPKTISETQENEEFDVTSDSTSMEDLLDLSLDKDAVDVSQPGFKKKKDITISTTNDIISNVDDGTLQPNPTNSDDKSYTIQKNDSIKTPDKIDTVVPKSTEKVLDLSTKPSINGMDVSDSLKEYNRLGGFTMEDADLGKMKDKSPSSVLKNKNKKDLKDSQEKTIQNPNRNIHQYSIPTNAVIIPKTISETQENEEFDVTSDYTSMEDLLGLSLDINAVDVSQPGFKKKKDITISTTNDIISNVDDGTLQPNPTNSDDKSYTIQKNDSIKTPDKIDTVVPKSTEKVLDLSTKPSINGMDVSDSLKEYNRLGGFTMEDADLGKMKDKSPSSVLKNKNKKDLKDSQEKTIQNPNRNIHQYSIPTNAVIIPKTISETQENEKFDVTSDSTSMEDLLGLSLDIDAVDVSQPGFKKKKDITLSTTNDIISNVDDGTLQPYPTNSDHKSYTIQKNESIKTPDKIDIVVPKSTEKVLDLSTKPSINGMDVSDSLKEYNRLGGFTTEDADLGKMKDKSPSSVLKNKNKKDLKDSQEKTIQNPNRNIHQTSIPTNAVIIPKTISETQENEEFDVTSDSTSMEDLLDLSLDKDAVDVSQPGFKKKKDITISTTNDIISNVDDGTLQPNPTNSDDKSYTIQKNESIKTPDKIDTVVPKSTEKVLDLSTKPSINGMDVSDSLKEYNRLGGFTTEDADLGKMKDKSPSSVLKNKNKKDLKDSQEKTIQNPNRNIHQTSIPTNAVIIPKTISETQENEEFDVTSDSTSMEDLLDLSLDKDAVDVSQPGFKKKKDITISTTNDIISNVDDGTLQPNPTNSDDKSYTIQKNESIKTPDKIDTVVPKSTEKVLDLSTKPSINGMDVSDSLKEYNRLGGFTMEDADLGKMKDKSPSSVLKNKNKKDLKDSQEKTIQNPNRNIHQYSIPTNAVIIPKTISETQENEKFDVTSDSTSMEDLLGLSLDIDAVDVSQPGFKKKKDITLSTTNDIISNVDDGTLQPYPTNSDHKSYTIQKNESIKTPDKIDIVVPKSTEKVLDLSTKPSINGMDVSDSLKEYNRLGGFTTEDADLGKMKDKSPSSVLKNKNKKDLKDSQEKTIQNPNRNIHQTSIPTNAVIIPKTISETQENEEFDVTSDSTSMEDLLDLSLDKDAVDVSQPGFKKKKDITISTTNDIISNVDDGTLQPNPTNSDDKSYTIQKNESIKTPDKIDTVVPKSTEKVLDLSTKPSINGMDVSDSLKEYNRLGGFTMEDADLGKMKDKSPSSVLKNKNKKDLKDSQEKTIQNPNRNIHQYSIPTNAVIIPKTISETQENEKFDVTSDSTSMEDLLGLSLDIDAVDVSQPGFKKKKDITLSTTNDIISNVDDGTLQPNPTNSDDKSYTIQKNESIKTPDKIDTVVPKSTEKVLDLSTKPSINGMDVSDSLKEYNRLGGFTMEDADLGKMKDKSPSSVLKNKNKKDLKDSQEKTIQNPNRNIHQYSIPTNAVIIPKTISETQENEKFDVTSDSTSMEDLLGLSLDIDAVDVSQPGFKKKKDITLSTTNDIISNVDDGTLQPYPTNSDHKSYTIQKNESIKTPDKIDIVVPKSTEKVLDLSTKPSINGMDVSDSLKEYNRLGGFTTEDADLGKMKDKSPSSVLKNKNKKDLKDSQEKTIQNPNRNIHQTSIPTNAVIIPKTISETQENEEFDVTSDSTSMEDLLDLSLDKDAVDVSQPGFKKNKDITISTTNDIISNVDDGTLQPNPTNSDDKSYTIQKNESIKTPDKIDTVVPKSTEKVLDLSTKPSINGMDVSDSLKEYNRLGGFTMEDADLGKMKDKSPSSVLKNKNKKDLKDSQEKTIQNPNRNIHQYSIPTNAVIIPKTISETQENEKFDVTSDSTSMEDLLGLSLDIDAVDVSQPGFKKKKDITLSTTNDIISNVDDGTLQPNPTNSDDKSYTIQKNESIKTPDKIDTVVPKSTEKVLDLSTKPSINGMDVSDSLKEYNRLGGFTMEDADLGKMKDKSPSSVLKNKNKKDLKDSQEKTIQNPNRNIHQYSIPTNAVIIPKTISETQENEKFDVTSDSTSMEDLLGLSLDIDAVDVSQPEFKKKKDITLSTTNDIISNVDDGTLQPYPTNSDHKSYTIQKNESIKTPDKIDIVVPKSTEKVLDLSTKPSINGMDVSDSLKEYNRLGGFTMEDANLGKMNGKSPSSVLKNKNKKDLKDSQDNTIQNPNRNIHQTSIQTNAVVIPKTISETQENEEFDVTSDSTSMENLLGLSLDIDAVDVFQPGFKKKKDITMSTTNDIISNVDDGTLRPNPTNSDDKSYTIQKNESIKTPDKIDTVVPKSTEKVLDLSTKPSINGMDVSDSLKEYNRLGGFTMEDADLGKMKDKSPSSVLKNKNKKDLKDSQEKTIQNPNRNIHQTSIPTNAVIIPKTISETQENEEFDVISDSTSMEDLLDLSLDKDAVDVSQPGFKKKKDITISTTNDIISNVDDGTLQPNPTNSDDKSYTIQKNESIKTPDKIDTVVPKSTEKVLDLSTKPSINGMDVSDSLKEYNRLGGFTMEDADLGKMKDKSPSSVLKNKNKKDLKDSQEKTIQNPNRNIHQYSIPTNAVIIPKTISETQENEKFDVTSDSTSMEDLLGLSLDIDAVDVSQPGFKKKKDITMSTTNDIISNVDDGTLRPNPTNSDDKSYTIQKNESIKTPDKIDTVVPKSTEKVLDLSTKPSINGMDVSDSLKEYNRLGGFTMEDADLGKMKDKSPSSVLKNKNKKDLKDSQDNTIQNPIRNIHQTSIQTNAVVIPKTISETLENEEFDVTSDSTSMEDLLGLSLDIDAVDVSQPGFKKKKDITMSTTNDIISNGDDGTLQPNPTNSDDKSYTIQKNESIKTPDKIYTVVPKSTEKVPDLSTKPSINSMDVSDSLKEYNRLGGFTTEDADLGKMKDKSPSLVLKNKNKKDLKDSQEKTIQNPNRNIHQTSIPTNAVIIPKTISETQENEEFDVTSDSTSMEDLLDLSLDKDAVDVSQPGFKKKKDITISTTNDIISNVDDGTLQPNPTNSDDKSYTIQKNESIKTPDKIDTVVPKSTEKVLDLSTKPSINGMDVSDSLKEYNRLGGFTMEDADLGKMKDKSPSSVLKNKNKKDLKDSQEKTIQYPNRNIHQYSIPTNAVIIPKTISETQENEKFDVTSDSTSMEDLLGLSLDIDAVDVSQPGFKKKKDITLSTTNDIISNVDDGTLQPYPTNSDHKSYTIQKNESIKTPDKIDIVVPKSTEKVLDLSTKPSINGMDVSDSLKEYNRLGGFTMEDANLGKMNGKSPSSVLKNKNKKDLKDSQDNTIQNPNRNIHQTSIPTNAVVIPKTISETQENEEFDVTSDSTSMEDLLDLSLDKDAVDLSQPGFKKKKDITISTTNDIISNVDDGTLQPNPTNSDDKSYTIQKNESIKTPDKIDTVVPKSTEKVLDLSTKPSINGMDVSDSLKEYNRLGGFTMEDADLGKMKDKSPSSVLKNKNKKDLKDSQEKTIQYPNRNIHQYSIPTNAVIIPKTISETQENEKFDVTSDSTSMEDLLGLSLDIDAVDVSQPGFKKKKDITLSTTNDIISNVDDGTLQPYPTNSDHKSYTIQKNESIKTPDKIDIVVPKSTEKVLDLSTKPSINGMDVSDSLKEYNRLGGFTMEDANLGKMNGKSPSSVLKNKNKKDLKDSQDNTIQNPNRNIHQTSIPTNAVVIPKTISETQENEEFDVTSDSTSMEDLLDLSLDKDAVDLSQPGFKKKKDITISTTNDIISNVDDGTLQPNPTNSDDKSYTIQKNESIKTPDKIDTVVPKSTEKVLDLSTKPSINGMDVSDSLKEYNRLGGFTMEDADLGKMKDKSPSSVLKNKNKKDLKDSQEKTIQNPNRNIHQYSIPTNAVIIPKTISETQENEKFDVTSDSTSMEDLLGLSLDIDAVDVSQPGFKKKKDITLSTTNDIISNVDDGTLQPYPTNSDHKSYTIQKNESIKTPDKIDIVVPKSTEKVLDLSTKPSINGMDVSDSLKEYNRLGGFTMEDANLGKMNGKSPSSVLKNKNEKDLKDSQDNTIQNPNRNIHQTSIPTNAVVIPKTISETQENEEFDVTSDSTSMENLLGLSLDIDAVDVFQPGFKKKKDITMSTTNDIISNVDDGTLRPNPTNSDDKSYTIQKNESIKTPDKIDTVVPKSTEKVLDLSTKPSINGMDVSDSLKEYNRLGGFTMEDADLGKMKDKSPSSVLKNKNKKDLKDSQDNTIQNPIRNIHQTSIQTNAVVIPKTISETQENEEFDVTSNSTSMENLLGLSLDIDAVDVSQPGFKKKKDITMSTTNDIISNVDDGTLHPYPTNSDQKSYTIQKNESIKTPDKIDIVVPKSTEKVLDLSTKPSINGMDVSDSLKEYNRLGGFTMEDADLGKMKDKSPSSVLNNNRKNDHDDSLQDTNQPMLMKPNTVDRNTDFKDSVNINFEEIPRNLSDNYGKIILDDKIYSNPIENFLGSSIGFDKLKLSLPGYEDKDFITKSVISLPNLDDVTLKSAPTNYDIKPDCLQKNKSIEKLIPVSNTNSKMFDLIEPTTQSNYDIIKNSDSLPLSKLSFNVMDNHSSNSNTVHNYNNHLLGNDKDGTFNRSFITNHFVKYNSNDLSSLEDVDQYGYMLPKFSTKYSEGGDSNYNLWEMIPPKKSDDVSSVKECDNRINDFNKSSGYTTTKNNKISTHTPNENNIITGTESVKNNYNYDKFNTDIHNKQYDDFIKKMSEQLFKKIDNIDDKLAKLDKVSHNCSYVREIGNIGSHEPTMNNVLLTNDIPITKPEDVINIEDSYSKTYKAIESLEINTSNKSDDENEINKTESPKGKKHKNKKHKRHVNKKNNEKNNTSNDDNGDGDGDDDDDDANNDDGNHKNNKRHKHKNINKDDDDKHKKNKRHKNKDLNNDDDNKHKKNKRYKKNKKINDNDNGGHRMKIHKKKNSKVDDDDDDDVVSKHKKHKNHKKKDRNYNDVEILRSKKTDNKKKKRINENVYSLEESNDGNYSSSIQINSENNDSVKRLKTISSKSKIYKKTNSTKSKKSSPKKKSKYVKHSKTIKYKNKEIPVDVSDEDTSSNENNYNSERTYIKYISNNNQNNVPKDKKHKHKKHNKHSKTSKTYINKKIPEDKNSDENSVNLEEIYNINIINDDDALRQKKHRHKKNKKKKNFDINIVKDTNTDTDTQVLNSDKITQNGVQLYKLVPRYLYTQFNPFARTFF